MLLLACASPEPEAGSRDDLDGDGFFASDEDPARVDCDDADPAVTPATERYVPAGAFTRGEDGVADAEPARQIALSAFCIDVVEVTNAQFVAFLEARAEAGSPNADELGRALYDFDDTDDTFPARIDADLTVMDGYADHPVVEVWHWSGEAYCDWRGVALPTEAQWEKAARGTDARAWPWGDEAPTCDLADVGPVEAEDIAGACVGDTVPVGSYPDAASPFGMLDAAGNVAEWVADWYDAAYYAASPAEDPPGPDAGWAEDAMNPDGFEARVSRGGNFLTPPVVTTTYARYPEPADATSNGVGFRCARSL
jgi:formylglycine-generating enzyme required for sulfatase activity